MSNDDVLTVYTSLVHSCKLVLA